MRRFDSPFSNVLSMFFIGAANASVVEGTEWLNKYSDGDDTFSNSH